MGWVREFNITVETVEHLFPQLTSRVDNIFYDAKSIVLALNSKLTTCVISSCHAIV